MIKQCQICSKEIEREDTIVQHGIEVCLSCACVLQSVDVCPWCHQIVNVLDSVPIKDSGQWFYIHHRCDKDRENYRKY